MRDREECVRLQKIAAEILAEFPDANYKVALDEAIKRGESFEDACYCAVVVCFG